MFCANVLIEALPLSLVLALFHLDLLPCYSSLIYAHRLIVSSCLFFSSLFRTLFYPRSNDIRVYMYTHAGSRAQPDTGRTCN